MIPGRGTEILHAPQHGQKKTTQNFQGPKTSPISTNTTLVPATSIFCLDYFSGLSTDTPPPPPLSPLPCYSLFVTYQPVILISPPTQFVLRVTYKIQCISYLLLCNKLPPNVAPKENKHLLSHIFCGSEI